MAWMGKALAAAWLAAALASAIAAPAQASQSQRQQPGAQLSRDALELVERVTRTGDHQQLPFAVVDKKEARIYVFDAAGLLRGTSAALLGQTTGDESAPDVGEHAQTGNVPLAERTTPAGRFVSEPGRNRSGEHVIWVDYDSAFAIHRVRPGRSRLARLSRLDSSNPADRRVSLGCVVVAEQFYKQVVWRWLGQGRSVVYVLPESNSVLDALNTQ
jgi:hypothetical protein